MPENSHLSRGSRPRDAEKQRSGSYVALLLKRRRALFRPVLRFRKVCIMRLSHFRGSLQEQPYRLRSVPPTRWMLIEERTRSYGDQAYGNQGELTIKLTSSVQSAAVSLGFLPPPSLAI
jgi:hypothetical protein